MRFRGQNASSEMISLISPNLKIILFDVNNWLKERGHEMTITSMIRPQSGDSGVHAAKRAFDISIKGIENLAQELCDYVNKKYVYGNGKKTAILNDGGNYAGQGIANHIHFQVPKF